MATDILEKIERWKKQRGNGPWIVLRLEPAKSNEDADLRLAEVIFRPRTGGEIIQNRIRPEWWNQYNGCRAVAIFLLLAAAQRAQPVEPGQDILIAQTPFRPSWPTSFSELIEQKKFEKSLWLRMVFGLTKQKSQKSQAAQPFNTENEMLDNGLALISKKVGRAAKAARTNEDVQRVLNNPKPSTIKLFLKARVLDPNKIFIIKGFCTDAEDTGLTSAEEIVRLARGLESRDRDWLKILKEEDLSQGLKPVPRRVEAIQTAPIREVEVSPTASFTHQSLSEIFKTLSVASIKSHIVAALEPGRGSAAVEKSLQDLLAPDCINVVAEKLVSESVESFCDFYHGIYDDLGAIKKSVARVFAVNSILRNKLAQMVARSGYRDMMGWFGTFSFYCDREIVVGVEQELVVAKEESGFNERFSLAAPGSLRRLIDDFSKYGCIVAVKIFKDIADEAKVAGERLNQILGGKEQDKK